MKYAPNFPSKSPPVPSAANMSLRDYFAAAALPAIIAHMVDEWKEFTPAPTDRFNYESECDDGTFVTSGCVQSACEYAFRVADAMLAERDVA
jgi:hypothetical protein